MNIDTIDLLESMHDGVYVSDRTGITVFVNRSYERMTGLNRDELIGRDVRDLEREGYFSPVIGPVVVETGKPLTVMQTNKAGKKIVVTGYPVFTADGKTLSGSMTLVRDLPQLEQLQAEIDHQRALIEKYRSEAERFFSHDLVHLVAGEKTRRIMDLAARLANVDTTVLITGETGVGKEIVAKTLHLAGIRKKNPFFSVNCAAIPENLIETELFGYAPGAFTGAQARGKPGLFELAHEGTLFLDEIAELPFVMQAKLLRVIQDKVISRIGGSSVVRVNTRVVAASNRDLDDMALRGNFRSDLLYRLKVATINVPPLRERQDEIAPFFNFFLKRMNTRYRRNVHFTSAAMEVICLYHWPGNVRELENLVESLVVAHPVDEVDVCDLPAALSRQLCMDQVGRTVRNLLQDGGHSLQSIMAEVERKLLVQALERNGYDVYRVAGELRCDRTTIQRKLKKYRIPRSGAF